MKRRFRFNRGSLPELVQALPTRQLLFFWGAIFFTFAMIGFTLDILGRGRQPAALLTLNLLASGILAVGYGMASMPMRRWAYAALIAIHVTYVLVIPRVFHFLPETPPGRLLIDAVGIIVTVTIAYTCFLLSP